MNILFDINHPADVHFFKNTIIKLKEDGHSILITARRKDVAISLLESLNLSFTTLSTARSGLFFLAFELLQKDIKLIPFFIKNKIDLAVAFTGTCISQVGWLLRVPSLVFYDNDEANLQNFLTYPFATKIYTPACYPDDLGTKHERFQGIKELSYLHPNYFQADKSIYQELKLEDSEKYIVIRTVSWGASHDVGQAGLSKDELRSIINEFSSEYKLFMIPEGEIDQEFAHYLLPTQKNRVHHVLAFADLFIGEGATMACECACLGTPAIYVNTLNPSHVIEVEELGLVYYMRNGLHALSTAKDILKNTNKNDWLKKSKGYIDSKEDVTEFVYQKINEYISSP